MAHGTRSTWLILALALALSAVAAASAVAHSSQIPPAAAEAYLTPVRDSEDCKRDSRRQSACRVIRSFFRAVNSRRFVAACAMLGKRLRSDYMGVTCPSYLDANVPVPVPWGILAAGNAGTRVAVLLVVGQTGLERIWMRQFRAFVGSEDGRWRILEVRYVR